MFASFELKYKSIDVKNTPPTSSIINVCASGSWYPTVLSSVLVDVLVIVCLSVTDLISILACLLDTIVSLTVSIVPFATYSAFAAVSTSAAVWLFEAELVNLNNLSPVLHLGFEFTLGSGIANVPVTAPFASVTKLPPKAPPFGVT